MPSPPMPEAKRQRFETVESNHQIIIITTDHWTETFFKKVLFPHTRYSDSLSNAQFCDIAAGTWEDNLEKLLLMLRKYGASSACLAITDVAMEIYSAAVEILKGEVSLRGASFLCMFLASNKLACRRLVRGCDGIRSDAVKSDVDTLPDLGMPAFFKPLAECGSKGTFKYEGSNTLNPLRGERNMLALNPKICELATAYEECRPYLDDKLVGLSEQYIDPAVRTMVVSVDGFVHNGAIHHYCISDNVYKDDNPDVFDSLVSPSQRLKGMKLETEQLWKLYDDIVGDLVRRGLDNQFVDYEAFVLPGGRVEVMEVNCRTFSNQLPIMARVFGEHCMMSCALDLLLGKRPLCADVQGTPDSGGKVGVCAYLDVVAGAPDFVESEDGSSVYYACGPAYSAHVFSIGTDGDIVRQQCSAFHKELMIKYAS